MKSLFASAFLFFISFLTNAQIVDSTNDSYPHYYYDEEVKKNWQCQNSKTCVELGGDGFLPESFLREKVKIGTFTRVGMPTSLLPRKIVEVVEESVEVVRSNPRYDEMYYDVNMSVTSPGFNSDANIWNDNQVARMWDQIYLVPKLHYPSQTLSFRDTNWVFWVKDSKTGKEIGEYMTIPNSLVYHPSGRFYHRNVLEFKK